MQLRHPIRLPRKLQRRQRIIKIVAFQARQRPDFLLLQKVKQRHFLQQRITMGFISGQLRRMRRENYAFTNFCQAFIFGIEVKVQRYRVSFVHIINVRLHTQRFQQHGAADTQYNALGDPGGFIGIVKMVRDRAGKFIIVLQVSTQQQQRCGAKGFRTQ